jgi:hypothetical protein
MVIYPPARALKAVGQHSELWIQMWVEMWVRTLEMILRFLVRARCGGPSPGLASAP